MKRLLLATTTLLSLATLQGALAATTAGMGVTATVSTVCDVTAEPIDFSEIALTGTTGSQTTVSATCTNGGTYNIGLSDGANATGGQRRLASGTNFLTYDLYSNTERTTHWGHAVGTDTVAGTGNGLAQSLDVFGAVTAGQALTTGAYTDTVQVSVTF
ncbi:MAG: spore coat U domain-containing protein [Rhizomicrobium sp.]